MKGMILAMGIVFLLGTTSCKKNWTCTCTVNGQESKAEFDKMSKKDAEDACSKAEASSKITDPNATCTVTKR